MIQTPHKILMHVLFFSIGTTVCKFIKHLLSTFDARSIFIIVLINLMFFKGLVRSPISATLPQIGSRLFLTWGILWSFPEVPLLISFVWYIKNFIDIEIISYFSTSDRLFIYKLVNCKLLLFRDLQLYWCFNFYKLEHMLKIENIWWYCELKR